MKRTFEGIAQHAAGRGRREAQIVKSEAERQRTEIVATSLADAQRIRGEGDAAAASIYAHGLQPQSGVLFVLPQPAGVSQLARPRRRRDGDLTRKRFLPLSQESGAAKQALTDPSTAIQESPRSGGVG